MTDILAPVNMRRTKRRKPYELFFSHMPFAMYASIQEALEAARRLYNKRGWQWKNTHPAKIIGPGLPEEGLRI